MTTEHLRPLLDDEETFDLLADAAEKLAQASIPSSIADALGLGRMVAIRKSSGKVRGIVSGDVFRRLVARTLAQQFSADF